MQFNSSASTKKKTKTMTILHLRKSIGLSPSLIKILPQMISQLSLIKRPWLATCVAVFAVVLPVASFAQLPSFKSQNVTGSLTSAGTVNVKELADASTPAASVSASAAEANHVRPVLRPPVQNTGLVVDRVPSTSRAESLAATARLNFRGFNGLTHLDQRLVRNGNQFSTEPPDQGLALGNGFVLEAVNSALNIYDVNGLPPGINRNTGAQGVFPGDPSAAFDPETQRWFVIAWAQLNTSAGALLLQSRLYIAVSETSDPTGTYTIYTLNTTAASDPDGAGARIPDFPHFAVDHYGVYISTNEFRIDPNTGIPDGFITAAITAISKQALLTGSGGAAPPVVL